jgi:hypothetical protein
VVTTNSPPSRLTKPEGAPPLNRLSGVNMDSGED